MFWLTNKSRSLALKIHTILYCFILKSQLYWYVAMDMHMCTYPSPLISDQYDYNIYNVNVWSPGLFTRFMWKHATLIQRLMCSCRKITWRLSVAFVLTLISNCVSIFIFVCVCVVICIVILSLVKHASCFVIANKHLETWNLWSLD